MADHADDRSPPQHSHSSPASPAASDDATNAQRGGAAAATKDRTCPFCRQPFTSSSLGRHLDTFIRDRNPKAPDGVHDVTEIRKIRSAITRRHARFSAHTPTKKKTQSPAPVQTTSASIQRPLPAVNPPQDHPLPQPVQPRVQPPRELAPHAENHHPDRPLQAPLQPQQHHKIHRAHWTATGVINNIPPRTSTTPVSRDLPFPRPSDGYKAPLLDAEDRRNAQAMEMAFKEVLRTVHEAADRAHRRALFDFDIFSLNFPALCFKILSAPPSLFSTTPQPNDKSWPLELPTHKDLEHMKQLLLEQIQEREHLLRQSHSPSDSMNDLQVIQRSEYQRYFHHMDDTFTHWKQLNPPDQMETWKLELMRAFAENATQRKQLESQLEQTRHELDNLKSQYRSPHSALYAAPILPQMSQQHLKELLTPDINLSEWDFDRLVAKFRSVLPAHRTPWSAPAQHTPPDRPSAPSAGYRQSYAYTPHSGYSEVDSPADGPARLETLNGGGHAPGYDNDVQMGDAAGQRLYSKDSAV